MGEERRRRAQPQPPPRAKQYKWPVYSTLRRVNSLQNELADLVDLADLASHTCHTHTRPA